MTVPYWLTKSIPLDNERDMMARIGLRFLCCTGPYFLIAIILYAFGRPSMLLSMWLGLFFLLIPFVGGVIDWYRLKDRSKHAPGTMENLQDRR